VKKSQLEELIGEFIALRHHDSSLMSDLWQQVRILQEDINHIKDVMTGKSTCVDCKINFHQKEIIAHREYIKNEKSYTCTVCYVSQKYGNGIG